MVFYFFWLIYRFLTKSFSFDFLSFGFIFVILRISMAVLLR
ncbi:hypothetical protein SEHO0A_01786 [Salmonella enterica subsp. houtenae str. ATCC BAA-1581]|nr:hypothetical protein SEHO0A_01786 [Salmonella enterica subsp. houtenae str. ATCC BAA-1581]